MKTGRPKQGTKNVPFECLYRQQAQFQKQVLGFRGEQANIPSDDINWSAYHMLALAEEIGELIKSDKRWKTHRNAKHDPENRLEELADCIITLMNIAMFSGFSAEELLSGIETKIQSNYLKLQMEEVMERLGNSNS